MNVGDFVKYDGKIWIIALIERPPLSGPLYWLVDQWGGQALWSANERSDGSFASPITPAKPRKLRGELEKQAAKWRRLRA